MAKTRLKLFCGLSFLLISFAALAGGGKTGEKKHDIKITLVGFHNTVSYLGCQYGENTYIFDTAKIDDKGNLEFSGPKELDGGIYFVVSADKRKLFEFIIDKEQKFSIKVDTTDYIKSMRIVGSEENDLFYQFQQHATEKHEELEKLQKQAKDGPDKEQAKQKIDTLDAQMKRYRTDFMTKHSGLLLVKLLKAADEPEIPPAPKLANGKTDSTFAFRYYKAHFFDAVDFSEGRLIRSPVFYPKIEQYLKNLTVPSPDSVIVAVDYLIEKSKANKEMFKFMVAYLIYKYEASEIMGMDAVFVHIAKKYYTPDQAYWSSASQIEKVQERASLLAPILIGKHVPQLVLPDTNNVMQPLDSVRARFTVVYFWDYDCGHCQKETPKLIKWYDSIKGEGVEVYAVEINEANLVKWKEYIRKHNLDWINVSDIFHTSNFHHDFDVQTTPMIYVLNEDKMIIAKKIDVEDLNKVLKHYMEKGSGK